jgi:hypothetical protein
MGRCRRLAYLASAGALGLAIVASLAAASTVEMTTPFSSWVTNPCNGELVYVVGESHTVTVMNDNRVEIQENWPDTSGVATTGTRYQVNDANHTFAASVPDGGFTLGIRDSFELVSEAPSANFLIHASVEFIVDPRKGPSIKIRGTDGECSGPTH